LDAFYSLNKDINSCFESTRSYCMCSITNLASKLSKIRSPEYIIQFTDSNMTLQYKSSESASQEPYRILKFVKTPYDLNCKLSSILTYDLVAAGSTMNNYIDSKTTGVSLLNVFDGVGGSFGSVFKKKNNQICISTLEISPENTELGKEFFC